MHVLVHKGPNVFQYGVVRSVEKLLNDIHFYDNFLLVNLLTEGNSCMI